MGSGGKSDYVGGTLDCLCEESQTVLVARKEAVW